MIDLLLLYGGDVEKFAGDCMIVVFLPTPEEAQGALACCQQPCCLLLVLLLVAVVVVVLLLLVHC